MNKKIIGSILTVILLFSSTFAQNESKQAELKRLTNELSVNLSKKDFNKVIEVTSRMIELAPTSASPYYARAVGYMANGDYNLSVKDFDKALMLGLEGDIKLNAIRFRSFSYYELKDYKNAIEGYSVYLQTKSNDYSVYSLRGFSYFYTKQFEKAISDFDSTIELKSEQTGLYRYRGIAKYKLGKYEEAIKDFDKEISINPTLMESYKFREKSYRELGKLDLANKDLEKYTFYLIDEITKHIDKGEFTYAINLAEELVEFFPNIESYKLKSKSYSLRGLDYLTNAKYEKAAADFNQSIKDDKESALGYFGRAKSYLGLGKYNEAFADAKKTLELDSTLNVVHSVLSVVYFEQENYEESIKSANIAIEANIDDFDALKYRGFSLYTLNKPAEALKDFNRALEIFPDDVDILFRRVLVTSGLGNWAEARTDLNKILTLDKNNLTAISLRAASNFALQENLDQVVADITLIEKMDKSALGHQLYKMRAFIYRKQGKIPEAIADEKKAKELEILEEGN